MQSREPFPKRDADESVDPRPIRALQCVKLGPPTDPLAAAGPLTISHLRTKPLAPNAVRIRVHAAALNFADALQIQGKYQVKPKMPFIPGSECSGVLVDVGHDVRNLKVGDAVCAVTDGGSFAEMVDVPAGGVIKLPKSVDLEAAAGLPVCFGTAYLALHERANIQRDQVVLILGAGGGVGLAAVQLARLAGAKVIAVARGKAKYQVLKSLGADAVIDTQNKKPSQLKDLVQSALRTLTTNGSPQSGVDIVFDTVGGSLFSESLRVVKWGAQILLIGFASGDIPKIAANIALVKNMTIHGVFWGSYRQFDVKTFRKSLEETVKLFAEGDIVVNVSHKYALEQAREAFQVLLNREVVGKLLFVPTPRSML